MSVVPEKAGITAKHIRAIEWCCKDVDTFLFVRPSTPDTMRLIDQGYATKSMDIHDKSSDWGPMAGLVPCDPAFSKALKGSPNNHPAYEDRGEAKVVRLKLTDTLADPLKNPAIKLAAGRDGTPTLRYVTDKEPVGAKSTVFKLEKKGLEWEVSWIEKLERDRENAVPLYVWGYHTAAGTKPVTGDYDLWMVCPHVRRWRQHFTVMGIQDAHGESGATEFITWLLEELNERCGRATNHVFHHGAEAQNYGFTQALDTKPIVMFTPTGTSELVNLKDLPTVLVDVQNAGYLVYINKRYGEGDPHLMGSAVNAGVAGGSPRQTAIEALMSEANLVKTGGVPQVKTGNLSAMFREEKAQKLIQKNLLGRGDEVPKIQQIQAFSKALKAGTESLSFMRKVGFFKILEVNKHIPRESFEQARGDVEGILLQQKLQEAVVKLSQMDHGYKVDPHEKDKGPVPTPGATIAPSPEKWEAWKRDNRVLLDQLRQKFGNGQPAPMRFTRLPGERAYKAVSVPRPETPPQSVDQMLGPFAELFNKMFPPG
jgi:hypothetical protein